MGNNHKNTKKIKYKEDISDNSKINNRDIYITPLTDYKYFNRRVFYYSEKYEISESEKKRISELIPEKINLTEFPYTEKKEKIKIIIDTDLGTDWDDAMAIIYALNISNLEILGITTNYGIPKLRAKVVQKILDAYYIQHPDKKRIPVISGASRPMGTHRELFIFGNEGKPFYDNKELNKNLENNFIMNQEQENASNFIVEQIKKYPNEVKIVSIGIPTNIGLALKNNKEIIPLINEIIIMGCGSIFNINNIEDYEPVKEILEGKNVVLYPNHNISGDTIASKFLFDSNIKTKIVSHSVSSQFWSEGPVIDFLRENAKNEKDIKNPKTIEGAVGLLMEEWFKRRYQNGQCPHDPLTINEAIFDGDDSPIIYARGYIILHEWAAFSTFIPRNDGPHYLGIKVKNNNNFLKKLENTIIGNTSDKKI